MLHNMRKKKMSRKTIEALVFAAVMMFSVNAFGQDCGCASAGFAGGTSVLQGSFAPQQGFVQQGGFIGGGQAVQAPILQPYANPGSAGAYDSRFGPYSSNCGRAITNDQAAALWSSYCTEDCTLNLPYQPKSRFFGGAGLKAGGGCGHGGCGRGAGGGWGYPGGGGCGCGHGGGGCGCGHGGGGIGAGIGYGAGIGAYGAGVGGYGAAAGGCHHGGCGLGRKSCGLLGGLKGLFGRRGGGCLFGGCHRRGGTQLVQGYALAYPTVGGGFVGGGGIGGGVGNRIFSNGYGWGGGAGVAGNYGRFLGGGYTGFSGYGLPIANAGSYGGGGCGGCKLLGALARLIGHGGCCHRRGGGQVAVSNQVFQSYYSNVGAGPSYFDYALGHQYGTGDFGVQSAGTFASQITPMQFQQAPVFQSAPQQTFTSGNSFGIPAASAIGVPATSASPAVILPATAAPPATFPTTIPGGVPTIQQGAPCTNCNSGTGVSNAQQFGQQFEQRFGGQQTFPGTTQRSFQTAPRQNSGQFVGGPNRVPMSTRNAPGNLPAQGSIIGESVPLTDATGF